MKTADHLRAHAVNAEGDQFVSVEIAEMLVLHLPRKFQADIHHRHAELLLVVDREAERLHLARIIRVWLEVDNTSAFPIVQESFALDLARIARDGEVNVLTSSFREVHALERTRRPV